MSENKDEIKAGEYIRTYRYGFCKVTDEGIGETDKGDVRLIELDNNEWAEIGSWIKAHSKNIIDLIEARDFVNGERVTNIMDNGVGTETGRFIAKEHIDTILTHEMYEQNCYKIGE